MKNTARRNFLKLSGLGLVPALVSWKSYTGKRNDYSPSPDKEPVVKFFGDGELYDPAEYLGILQTIMNTKGIEKDRYGVGGAVAELEKKFEAITGKEKAIFMPSGTMANQVAIALLSRDKTKIYLQDTSHIYRDEADAAQSVFGKRLMPLAKDKTYFTAADLQQAIASLKQDEVFESGIGAVAIENPVRRSDGRMVPVEEIRSISNYCRQQNIKLHLDGARLFMASAWSGISIKEYAFYFDTVYMSLYKYLGAAAGAMLCGDKNLIEQVPHLLKIHGGSMYGNWANAAMALDKIDKIDALLQQVIERSGKLFSSLNKQKGISVKALDGGTNIYQLQLDKGIDGKKFHANMKDNWKIKMGMPDQDNRVLITVNETLLYRDEAYMINAFKDSVSAR